MINRGSASADAEPLVLPAGAKLHIRLGRWVGGGDVNDANGPIALVSGGLENIASSFDGSVLGGDLNTASGFEAAVVGGAENRAEGAASAILGGRGVTLTGELGHFP
jgi:hypothetical protein